MRADQIEALKGQRSALADQVQALLDTPLSDRPTKPSALRSWLRQLDVAQGALARFDQILASLERRSKPTRPPARPAAPSGEAQDLIVLANIPKGRNAQLRVGVTTWQGRRTIDVRVWCAAKGSDELKPTRRGVCIDASKLNLLIEALHLAQQHA